MPRPFTPKVVTANALLEGYVVYLTQNGQWTRHHAEAVLIEDEVIAELRLREAQTLTHQVVGPYLADARLGSEGPEPIHFREAFRIHGPSNYSHGKQETRR